MRVECPLFFKCVVLSEIDGFSGGPAALFFSPRNPGPNICVLICQPLGQVFVLQGEIVHGAVFG